WEIGTADVAVHAIRSRLWSMYSDWTNLAFEPARLASESAALWQRCIAFLATGLPYRWSRTNFISPIGLLRFAPFVRLELAREESEGEWVVWPFFEREEREKAIGLAKLEVAAED